MSGVTLEKMAVSDRCRPRDHSIGIGMQTNKAKETKALVSGLLKMHSSNTESNGAFGVYSRLHAVWQV